MLFRSFTTIITVLIICTAAIAVQQAAVVAPNGTFYIIGGTLISNPTSFTSTHQVLKVKLADPRRQLLRLPSITTVDDEVLNSQKSDRNYQFFADRSSATIIYDHWLISCFGDGAEGCTRCFDTRSFVAQPCINNGQLPPTRSESSLAQVQDHIIMYGGSRQDELLGDVWRLDLSQTPSLVWSQIKSSWPPRAGHTTVPLNSSTFLVYGGKTNDQRVASLDYVHLPNRLGKRAPMESTGAEEEKGGLNGGAIAGIVIGICAFLAIAISVIVWTRRQQQRRLHYFHGRSTRFSLSTPPPSRPTSTRMGKTTSLPEMSHIVAPEASRLSTLSFGSDFRIPVQQQQQQQQQDNRASFSSASVPQSRFDTRTDSFMASLQYPAPAFTQQQRRESSGSFKRLTLNISSALRTTTTRDETTPSPSILKRYTVSGLAERRRSSMMFGLRASRFLHIPGSNNNDASTSSSISNEPLPRMSYDARSVSSVQWVGFNDTMDYREQQWSPNVQLAVTNQQRRSVSSSRPTSYAAESVGSSSSPRSAVFRFSNTSVSEPYRLSIQEIHSWEDHLNHRIMRTRLPPSSSSLPSRTIERFNNYRISTDSSDEGSIVVASGTATTRA